jgi:hypothetical protein
MIKRHALDLLSEGVFIVKTISFPLSLFLSSALRLFFSFASINLHTISSSLLQQPPDME